MEINDTHKFIHYQCNLSQLIEANYQENFVIVAFGCNIRNRRLEK